MYSELLLAALTQRQHGGDAGDTRATVDEARRRRVELELDVPPAAMEPDAVPVLLARQVGYDVALVRLARLLGIDTEPRRFDRPGSERFRLESALREHGIRLDEPTAPPGRAFR